MDRSEFGVSHTERESMHRYTVTRINIAMQYKNRCLLRIKDIFEITASIIFQQYHVFVVYVAQSQNRS